MTFLYLLDENLPETYRWRLLQPLPALTVWTTGSPGTPAKGAPDPEILLWCEAHGFLLITANRRSMPAHLKTHLASGHHVPGILILRPQASLAEVIDDLVLIASAATPSEFFDSITYVPLS